MDSTVKKNSIILVVVVILLGTLLVLLQQKDTKKDVFTDPDSQQRVVRQDETKPEVDVNPDKKITLSVDQKLFDLGLTADEFQAFLRIFNDGVKPIYHNRYQHGAVNTDSITLDSSDDTYSFDVRLGDPGINNPRFHVTVRRVKFNLLNIIITDKDNKSIISKQEKVYQDF